MAETQSGERAEAAGVPEVPAESRLKVRAWRERVAKLAGPCLVALVALKAAYGELATVDIGFDDEGAALEHGLSMKMPTADWAPLYSLWYAALSLVIKNTAYIYYANWFVLVTALPILLYALARRLGSPHFPASVVAIMWTLGQALRTWPFVTLFATALIALSAIAISYAKTWSRALAVTSATVAVGSYVRPEFAGPAIVVAVAAACCAALAARKREARTASATDAVVAVAPLVALRMLLGNPMSGARAGFAFGQHYALNRVEAERLGIDPWTNWVPLYRAAFPHANSPLEAARENFDQFAWHVLRNVRLIVPQIASFVSPLPHVPSAVAVTFQVLLSLVVGGGIVALLGPRRRIIWERFGKLTPLLAIVLVTTLGALVIVRPRQHYVVTAIFLAFASFAAFSGSLVIPAAWRWRWSSRLVSWDRPIAAGLLLLVLVVEPTLAPGRAPSLLKSAAPPPPEQFEGFEAVKVLRSLRLKEPVTILESAYSRGLYAGLRFKSVTQAQKTAPFWQFVHDHGVDVVVVDDRLRHDPRFALDPEFIAFQDGSSREDFRFFPIPQVHVDVAVRARLLP